MNTKKNAYGFTLIEAMIVIAVLGILSAIAYSAYTQQIIRSGRSEARVEITQAAQRLQRCFTTTSTYDPADGVCSIVDQLTSADGLLSSDGFYLLTAAVTPTTYTLTATAVAGLRQAEDLDCRAFVLTHTGVRSSVNSNNADSTDRCW